MNRHSWVDSLAVVLGLVLGPFAQPATREISAPLESWHLPLLFAGAFFAMLFVIGSQIARGDPKYGNMALALCYLVNAFVLGIGLSVLAMDILIDRVAAASLIFAVIGAGFAGGILVARLIFNAKYGSPFKSESRSW